MTSNLETIARGDASRIVQPRRTLVRDEAQWRALWAAHAGPDSPTPAVDFRARLVAAVFLGQRPTAGYDVLITSTRLDGAALTILVQESRPAPGAMHAQVLVSPFHIVSLPRFDGDVQFADAAGAVPPAAPAARPVAQVAASSRPDASSQAARTPDTTSATGLAPQMAGALAYLAGPFSGALLLGVERTNRDVRFHAWQALIGLGGLGVVAVGFLGLAFALLLASPNAFYTTLWLAAISALVWVALWAVCLIQAYKGRRWKIPFAGSYAERLSR